MNLDKEAWKAAVANDSTELGFMEWLDSLASFIKLPGSEGWVSAYEYGEVLSEHFPGRDAEHLAMACEYNGWGPLAESADISSIFMLEQGERDEKPWVWQIEFENGEIWKAAGGCDYTGWDCQSYLDWERIR